MLANQFALRSVSADHPLLFLKILELWEFHVDFTLAAGFRRGAFFQLWLACCSDEPRKHADVDNQEEDAAVNSRIEIDEIPSAIGSGQIDDTVLEMS